MINRDTGSIEERYHFIGIGGIGMSALARMLLHIGCTVSGSDVKENIQTARLSGLGAEICIRHSAENIRDAATVVYSSAIDDNNPELVEARDRGLRTIRRGELLGELFNVKKGIAISGTHGKTTTTALMALILVEAGLKPDAFIGGEVDVLDGNAVVGAGEYIIAEADESDGSLLYLSPFYSILTNIEAEHLAYFKNIEAIIELFQKFLNQTDPHGGIYVNVDDPHLDKIYRKYAGNKVSYGFQSTADICADNIRIESFGSRFDVMYNSQKLGEMKLNIPGMHNVSNSLGPIALAVDLGIGFEIIKKALAGFRGVRRRFEVKGEVENILVIDDYAHHPTEIMATVSSAKAISGMKRIIGIFQPHRFSRTMHLKDRFSESFDGLDEIILTDIYSASEKPIEGISGKTILDGVVKRGNRNVEYFENIQDIPDYLCNRLRPGDVVLTMGAGNIDIVADSLVEKLKEKVASKA